MDEGNKKNTKTDWLKKNFFNIIFALIFGIGGYLLWNNTKPQEPKSIQELINTIKDNAKTVIEDSTNVIPPKIDDFFKDYTIIKRDKLEHILKAVALVSRQEAAEDYHKSFSIFVAMLALFGIGFPAFVAFMQHRFNERQLDEIKEASIKANNAIIDAAQATKDTNKALIDIQDAKDQANKALDKTKETLEKTEKIKQDIHDIEYELHNEIIGIEMWLQSIHNKKDTVDCYNLFIEGQIIYHRLKRELIHQRLRFLEDILIKCESYADNIHIITTKDEKTIEENIEQINNTRICSKNIAKTLKLFIELITDQKESENISEDKRSSTLTDFNFSNLEIRMNSLINKIQDNITILQKLINKIDEKNK